MSFVTVRILDIEGNLCPNSENLVEFELKGEGEIVAVGNGNPATTELFQSNQRKAFSGQCMVYIKASSSPGEIILKAKSDGLEGADITIQSEKVTN